MDDSEVELIRSRLCNLILHTDCNTDLLSFFHEKRILSIFDLERIAAKKEGSERASEFYVIIKTRKNAFQMLLEGLKKTRQKKALEILAGTKEGEDVSLSVKEVRDRVRKLLRDDSISRSSVFFAVEPPVHLFTGRTKELEDLHQMILKSKEGKTMTVISQLATVSGLGGIGKTQLARQYISKRSSFFNENVIWLNAEDQGSLSTCFCRLAAEKLNLSTKDGNGAEKAGKVVAEEVYKYFEGRRALFVFDNAALKEEGGPWLRELLPNPKKNPEVYILMTSRNREWGVGAKVMSLGELTQAEAVSMVKQGLEIKEEDNKYERVILKLTETLQCFPLALHQAISYIHEQRQISKEYSVQTYISEFKTTKQEVMLSYRDADSLDDTYLLTTATTWKMTTEKIKNHPEIGPVAIFLLFIMSYFNPSNINRDILYTSLHKHPGLFFPFKHEIEEIAPELVNASVRLLVKYSMVNCVSKDQSILSIHRLVQTVTRLQLEKNKNEAPFELAALCLDEYTHDNQETFLLKNIEHVKAIWKHSPNTKENISLVRNLAYDAAEMLWKCGRLDEGIRFCKEILTKYKEVFGEEDLLCLKIKKLRAVILAKNGHKKEAKKLLTKLLEKARAKFGEQSEIFQVIYIHLQGLDEEEIEKISLETLRNSFEWKRINLGDVHKSTMDTQYFLAKKLMDMELYDEALKTFEDFIRKSNLVCESDKPCSFSLLEVEKNIAMIYFKSDKQEEALNRFQNIHQKFLPVWKSHAGNFSKFCTDYADVLRKAGQFKEALRILENCYKMLKSMYGNEHMQIPNLLNNIGWTQSALGRFKEALETHTEALQSAKTIYGENLKNLLVYKLAIISTLVPLGKIKESVCQLNQVQNQTEPFGIPEKDMRALILAFKSTGNNLEALTLSVTLINSLKSGSTVNSEALKEHTQEAISIVEKIKTEEEILKIWKSAFQNDTLVKEALFKFEEYQISHRSYLEANHDLLILNILFFAKYLLTWKLFKGALQLLTDTAIQKIIETTIMRNQKPALSILIAIGDAHFGLKEYDQALSYHKRAYEKLSYIHGDLYVTTIETKIRIATDLYCKRNHQEFLLTFEEIVETLRQLGENNPNDTDLTLNMLNYTMETFAILFKNNHSGSKQILADIQKMRENLESKILNEQITHAEEFIMKGSYEDALKVYKDVFQGSDGPIWNADVREVASICKNLGHVLNQLGKHEEALEILEGNLELIKTNLGSGHYWTYFIQASLANAYRGLGNIQKALNLHEGAYQGMRLTLDEDHEEMLILKKEIAVDLSLLGRHEESICLLLEVFDKLETTSGKESYELILAQIELAEAIERSNEDLQGALKILVNANEAMVQILDTKSVLFQRVLKIKNKLKGKLFIEPFNRAADLIESGNYEDALHVYKEEIYRKGDGQIYKADINLFTLTGKNVAFVLNKLGHHKESVEFLGKVLQLVKNEAGNWHPLIFFLTWNLASLRQSLGHFDYGFRYPSNGF